MPQTDFAVRATMTHGIKENLIKLFLGVMKNEIL